MNSSINVQKIALIKFHTLSVRNLDNLEFFIIY
jgi:hypothetical protein